MSGEDVPKRPITCSNETSLSHSTLRFRFIRPKLDLSLILCSRHPREFLTRIDRWRTLSQNQSILSLSIDHLNARTLERLVLTGSLKTDVSVVRLAGGLIVFGDATKSDS